MSRVWPESVFARSRRLVFAAGALFILITSAPIAGKAQLVEDSWRTSNAWSKLCFDVLKLSAVSETMKVCHTYVDIRDQPTGIRVGSIGVMQVHALKRTLFIAMLPLDATMNHEPGDLLFDDGTRIKLGFVPPSPFAHGSRIACGHVGCYLRAELSESLLERLKAAKALSFGRDDIGGRPPSIRLPCCFAEAVDGPPVYVGAQDETQRRMTLYLPQELLVLLQ
jgi:invasion protein IalB